MDLFFFTPENGNTTCSKDDEQTWSSISRELKLSSTKYDAQVCENGHYYEILSDLVERMPTGAEDNSLETIRRLYPREYYSLFASMSISPFFTMSLIRFKLGHEFDEILFGHDEAQEKSPWALHKIFIGPGILFNEYITAFEDTNFWQVWGMKVLNWCSDFLPIFEIVFLMITNPIEYGTTKDRILPLLLWRVSLAFLAALLMYLQFYYFSNYLTLWAQESLYMFGIGLMYLSSIVWVYEFIKKVVNAAIKKFRIIFGKKKN